MCTCVQDLKRNNRTENGNKKIVLLLFLIQTNSHGYVMQLNFEGSDPDICSKTWFYFEITTFNCNQSSIHLYFSLWLSRWPIRRGVALMLTSLCPLSESHYSHSSHLVLHLFICVVTRSSIGFHFNSFKHYIALCCAYILGSCPPPLSLFLTLSLSLSLSVCVCVWKRMEIWMQSRQWVHTALHFWLNHW